MLATLTNSPRSARPFWTMSACSPGVPGAIARPRPENFSLTAASFRIRPIASLRRAISGAGASAGAKNATHEDISNPTTVSPSSGNRGVARLLDHGQQPDPAGRKVRHRRRERPERRLDVPAQQIVGGGATAPIGHMDDVDSGLLPQQLAGEMMRGAGAGGAVVELPWIGPGVGDQFLHTECTGTSALTARPMMFAAALMTGAKSFTGPNGVLL